MLIVIEPLLIIAARLPVIDCTFSVLPGLKEKCVDSLVFETLIPKPMMQHYISLLLKHRRLILSGPSGTGKSYLATHLAEYLVDRSAREVTNGIVVTFNMHRQSCKVKTEQQPNNNLLQILFLCNLFSPCLLGSFPLLGSAALSVQPGQSDRPGRQPVRLIAGRHPGWYSRPGCHQWTGQQCAHLQISQMVNSSCNNSSKDLH